MRRIAFAMSFAILGLVACSNSNAKENGTTIEAASEKIEVAENNEKTETPGKPIQLTNQMFIDQIMDYKTNTTEWVYKGDMPGLIDFYADWCRPCKITSPILDELAKEYEGRIKVYKVNVDHEKELAGVFGVQSIPTFLFMPQEGKPSLTSGIARTPEETKAMFKKQIEELLLK